MFAGSALWKLTAGLTIMSQFVLVNSVTPWRQSLHIIHLSIPNTQQSAWHIVGMQ